MYKIMCILVGKESMIAENLSFEMLCDWLSDNKHKLFGYVIFYCNQSWDADYFFRYETKLKY